MVIPDSPDEIIVIPDSPDEIRVTSNSPDEIIVILDSPDEIRVTSNSPDEIIVITDSPSKDISISDKATSIHLSPSIVQPDRRQESVKRQKKHNMCSGSQKKKLEVVGDDLLRCVSLHSEDGERLLTEAKASGFAKGFLKVLTYLETPTKVLFCALTSLTTILNALSIDPKNTWKESSQWYNESALLRDDILERMHIQGKKISFCKLVSLVPFDYVKMDAIFSTDGSLEQFMKHISLTCSSDSSYILAAYSRSSLNMEGDGHFSPVAAYNLEANMVLVLDVVNPPFWVPIKQLWNAILHDPDQGYMIISKP